MTLISVGDMAQHFTSARNTGTIKSELSRLTQNLSTGKVLDLTAALGGETEGFSGLSYSLDQLGAYQSTNRETAQSLANVQIVLGQIDNLRGTMADRLLLVNQSSTSAQIDEAAQSSRSAFETAVNSLNTKFADRALFSGADVTQTSLASAGDMMTGLTVALAGMSDPAAIVTAVDNWFDDPAGGFRTFGYLGDTGPLVEKRTSDTKSIELTARADDPGIVKILKATALASLATELPSIGREEKAEILKKAGEALFGASTDLVAIQAKTGFAEGLVADAIAENSAQQTALSILQNDLVSADPFETASRLKAVQLQLEMHFSVVGRMSQLSLLRYI